MKVIVRADASVAIGHGHVVRCIALAKMLRNLGASSTFVCRDCEGNLADYLNEQGFNTRLLPIPECNSGELHLSCHDQWLGVTWQQDAAETLHVIAEEFGRADWLVVDHYGIDYQWEYEMRTRVSRILVLDDLANRKHDCDVLLDSGMRQQSIYADKVAAGCQVLLGPEYALLRDTFVSGREGAARREGLVQRIVVFLGGSDPSNETAKVASAISYLNRPDIAVDVIVGAANPRKRDIEQMCVKLPNVKFHCQLGESEMAGLFGRADLALGAAGAATWERMVLGLPAILVSIAENQAENLRQLEKAGVVVSLGNASQVETQDWVRAINRVLSTPDCIRSMSEKALALVDGRGAQRIAGVMEALT